MSDEAERWKEKYLQLVERQDRLEARWEQRVDLLRRSLVRSSLTGSGRSQISASEHRLS